jgi:hypothetical protein
MSVAREIGMSPNAFLQRLAPAERWLVFFASGWIALAVLHWVFGLEFEFWKAQKALMLVFWVTPFAFVVLSTQVRSGRVRVAAILVSSLLAMLSFAPASCAALEFSSMPAEPADLGFETILHQHTSAGDDLVLYRTSCGAVCPASLVLRQERRVVPGVQAARVIAEWHPAHSATLTFLSPQLVRLDIAPYGSRRPAPLVQNVRLRSSLLLP